MSVKCFLLSHSVIASEFHYLFVAIVQLQVFNLILAPRKINFNLVD
jgi:hypothetical protein